jgi:hypothetical protein
MLVCACIARESINGRAQGGLVAWERWRESRSPIFKFKSSLKTSAIAFHAVVVGVHQAPCTRGRSSKGQLQQQMLCSNSLSSVVEDVSGEGLVSGGRV